MPRIAQQAARAGIASIRGIAVNEVPLEFAIHLARWKSGMLRIVTCIQMNNPNGCIVLAGLDAGGAQLRERVVQVPGEFRRPEGEVPILVLEHASTVGRGSQSLAAG